MRTAATGLTARALAEQIREAQAQQDPATQPGWDHQTTRLAVFEAIRRLRSVPTLQGLLDAAPAELCRACGFSRSMIAAATASSWTPQALHSTAVAGQASRAAFADIRGRPIALRHSGPEAEVVRRRAGRLVEPRPTPGTVAGIPGRDAHVIVPILTTGRVIGLLHADRFGQRQAADAADRDHAAAFANELSVLIERVLLQEQLQQLTAALVAHLNSTADEADVINESGWTDPARVSRQPRRTDQVPASPARDEPKPAGLERLLSPREIEVLQLLSTGATNATIAAELKIALATVKSHLKRIFAKTRTSGRTQAAAWYLGHRRPPEHPASFNARHPPAPPELHDEPWPRTGPEVSPETPTCSPSASPTPGTFAT